MLWRLVGDPALFDAAFPALTGCLASSGAGRSLGSTRGAPGRLMLWCEGGHPGLLRPSSALPACCSASAADSAALAEAVPAWVSSAFRSRAPSRRSACCSACTLRKALARRGSELWAVGSPDCPAGSAVAPALEGLHSVKTQLRCSGMRETCVMSSMPPQLKAEDAWRKHPDMHKFVCLAAPEQLTHR